MMLSVRLYQGTLALQRRFFPTPAMPVVFGRGEDDGDTFGKKTQQDTKAEKKLALRKFLKNLKPDSPIDWAWLGSAAGLAALGILTHGGSYLVFAGIEAVQYVAMAIPHEKKD